MWYVYSENPNGVLTPVDYGDFKSQPDIAKYLKKVNASGKFRPVKLGDLLSSNCEQVPKTTVVVEKKAETKE